MCNFCKNIYTTAEAMKWRESWWDWDCEQPYTIIVVGDDDSFELWSHVDDNFYTGRVMDINYCPVCGKQLMK